MPTVTRDLDDLTEDLAIRGYTVIRTLPDPEALSQAATWFGAHLGARSMGVKILEGRSSPDWLPRHTENLTDPEPPKFFALGCIQAAIRGGATCLYDGRTTAAALYAERPQLAGVRITYATRYRPDTQTHPLMVRDPIHGVVLRYRSALDTNTVCHPLPKGVSEAEVYRRVEAALSESITLAHKWRPGDLLIVDNRAMIHARQPFTGTRRMIRFRFDDPNFRTVIIKG